MKLGLHSVKVFLAGRRERRREKRAEQRLDDLEQRKELLKLIAAGQAANKPPHW
jgi:hypothetical protein